MHSINKIWQSYKICNFRREEEEEDFSRGQIVRRSSSVWECDKRLTVHEVEVAEGRVGS